MRAACFVQIHELWGDLLRDACFVPILDTQHASRNTFSQFRADSQLNLLFQPAGDRGGVGGETFGARQCLCGRADRLQGLLVQADDADDF